MLAIVFFEIVFANLYALTAKLFWKAGKTSTKLGSIRYGRRWKLYLVQRSVHCTLSRQIKDAESRQVPPLRAAEELLPGSRRVFVRAPEEVLLGPRRALSGPQKRLCLSTRRASSGRDRRRTFPIISIALHEIT